MLPCSFNTGLSPFLFVFFPIFLLSRPRLFYKPYLLRADPTATTVENPKRAERWAFNHNHVGVLVELAKVKILESDIMESSLGELVRKEEEKEWREKMLEQKEEEGEWRKKMQEQQQEWQKEVVEMLKQQNRLISLLAKNLGQEKGNDV